MFRKSRSYIVTGQAGLHIELVSIAFDTRLSGKTWYYSSYEGNCGLDLSPVRIPVNLLTGGFPPCYKNPGIISPPQIDTIDLPQLLELA